MKQSGNEREVDAFVINNYKIRGSECNGVLDSSLSLVLILTLALQMHRHKHTTIEVEDIGKKLQS